MKKSFLLFLPLVFFACVASTCCEGLDGNYANAIAQKDSLEALSNLPSITRTMIVQTSKDGMSLKFNTDNCHCVDVDAAMTDAFAKVFGKQGDILATIPEVGGATAGFDAADPRGSISLFDPGWTSTGGVAAPNPPRPKKDPDLIISPNRMAKVLTGVEAPPVLISMHKYSDLGLSSFSDLKGAYPDAFQGSGAQGKSFLSIENKGFTTVAHDLGDGQSFVRIASFDKGRVGAAIASMQIQ